MVNVIVILCGYRYSGGAVKCCNSLWQFLFVKCVKFVKAFVFIFIFLLDWTICKSQTIFDQVLKLCSPLNPPIKPDFVLLFSLFFENLQSHFQYKLKGYKNSMKILGYIFYIADQALPKIHIRPLFRHMCFGSCQTRSLHTKDHTNSFDKESCCCVFSVSEGFICSKVQCGDQTQARHLHRPKNRNGGHCCRPHVLHFQAQTWS